MRHFIFTVALALTPVFVRADLTVTATPSNHDLVLAADKSVSAIFLETNDDPAVIRAAGDLGEGFARVTGIKPSIVNRDSPDKTIGVIIGTLGKSQLIDQLATAGKLATNGVSGGWENRSVTPLPLTTGRRKLSPCPIARTKTTANGRKMYCEMWH